MPDPLKRRHRLRQGLQRMQSKGLERLMFLTSGLLLGLVLAEATAVTFVSRGIGVALWRELLVEVTVGREAGFPIALEGGVPPLLLAQVSITQDVGLFCLLYPVFLRIMHRHRHSKSWFIARLRRVQAAAHRHHRIAVRWGPWGVFVFMLVPFLVNGPLIGGIMGRLAGIHTRGILLPVLASIVVAAFAWSYFYDAMLGLAGHLHPALPFLITACVLGALVSWLLLDEWLEARRALQRPKA